MKNFIIVLSTLVLLSSCKVNLLPKSLKGDKNAISNTKMGKAILEKTWAAHGFDKFFEHETYQFTFTDHWKGMMSGMGKLWPQKKTKMTLRAIPFDFDTQIEFLDGKDSGTTVGLNAWKYYEKEGGQKASYDVKAKERFQFGMSAFHYYAEFIDRMKNAPIIRYCGEEKMKGSTYQRVYVTWGSVKKSRKYDQYILYVNKSTNMLEYLKHTIRKNYLHMPGSGMFYGSVKFSDYRDVNGFKVPFQQTIFLNDIKKDEDKFLHQLSLFDFSFDGFDKARILP